MPDIDTPSISCFWKIANIIVGIIDMNTAPAITILSFIDPTRSVELVE